MMLLLLAGDGGEGAPRVAVIEHKDWLTFAIDHPSHPYVSYANGPKDGKFKPTLHPFQIVINNEDGLMILMFELALLGRKQEKLT